MWTLIAFSLAGGPQQIVPAQIVQSFTTRADCEQARVQLLVPDHVLKRYRFSCAVRS